MVAQCHALLEDDDNNITACVFSPNEKNGVTIQIHFFVFWLQ